MGEKSSTYQGPVARSFQNVRTDLEAFNIRLMLLEAENNRLRKRVEEQDELLKKQSVQQESQRILTETMTQNLITQAISEALKQEHTKAGGILSAETNPETNYNQSTEYASQMAIHRSLRSEPQQHRPPRPEHLNAPLQYLTPTLATKKHDSLKERFIKDYERNRRDIVKDDLLREIVRNKLTKSELREVVVEQKKYCSKATFYRYLDELEASGQIIYRRRNKKLYVEPSVVLELERPRS